MEKERIGNTKELSEEERIKIIERSSRTVGRAVFFSILVTLISFAPILFLEGQEKKLFSPLVFTKTFVMIGSAIVALFIVPMLLRSLMKGNSSPKAEILLPISSSKFTALFAPLSALEKNSHCHFCFNCVGQHSLCVAIGF
jgi:Cu(I)/Ag(I) efflux system membrane protein CusA/SilA